MGKTVDDGTGEDGVFEKVLPVLKGKVGGDDDTALAMAVGEQVEEQFASSLVEGNVAQFIQDD